MATTKRVECPAFTIEEGKVTKEAGRRATFRFEAKSARQLDGGLEISNINALLFDRDGRFVAKRRHEYSKTVLAGRASWMHEIPTDQLATATRLVYEVEHRFDVRRKLVAGELPALPAESDASEYWPWLVLDSRTLEDRTARFDFGLWAGGSGVEITYGQAPKMITDSFRTECELDFLDGDREVVATKHFSMSLANARPTFDDTSMSFERKVMRTLKFFELRAKTEARGMVELAVDGMP